MGFPEGDSLVDTFGRIVTGVLRRDKSVDFRALYGATIIFSDGDKATVKPDLSELGPSLSDCRVRRPDGYKALPLPGTACLVGWEGGDPSKRYVLLGALSGASQTQVDVQAALVNLGSSPATAFVMLATAGPALTTLFGSMQGLFTASATLFSAIGLVLPAVAVEAAAAAAAASAAAAAVNTYSSSASSYIATKVKAT